MLNYLVKIGVILKKVSYVIPIFLKRVTMKFPIGNPMIFAQNDIKKNMAPKISACLGKNKGAKTNAAMVPPINSVLMNIPKPAIYSCLGFILG